MTYLLDTHTLIWALTDFEKLSVNAQNILENRSNSVVVSTLSFWEMSIKRSIRKLDLDGASPEDFVVATIKSNFEILPLSVDVCASFHKLSATHHKDPFDRMLIWQSIRNELTLVTDDKNIRKYAGDGLQVVW